jgi:hypothetical protein
LDEGEGRILKEGAVFSFLGCTPGFIWADRLIYCQFSRNQYVGLQGYTEERSVGVVPLIGVAFFQHKFKKLTP